MSEVNDNLDSASVPPGENEKRDHSAQLAWMRKVNRYQSIIILALTAIVLTLATMLWQYRGINTYLNCVNLYALGVVAPECEPYREIIGRNTNIKNPGGALYGPK